ncbi:hypothetical protein [Spiroplasma floricola]|nr:hypothetical protein [Spiroplasma floricola]
MLLGQYLLIIIIVFINTAISTGVITGFGILLSNNSDLIVRLNLSFLTYSFISTIFLLSFILLLLLFNSLQVTTIICTLLISLTFLSNIPRLFVTAKEEQATLSFSSRGTSQIIKVTDLYESFDLQKYVTNYQIRYPYLSYALNKFLVDDNHFTREQFVETSSIDKRINDFWKAIGVVNTDTKEISAKDIRINTLPTNDELKKFQKNNLVTIKVSLENTFISQEELKYKINQSASENAKVLKDLYNFSVDIQKNITNFMENTSSFYDDFIFIDEAKSQITDQTNTSIVAPFKKDYLINMYKYNIASNVSLESGFTIGASSTENSFIRNSLFSPIMICARILEEYFINYTSKYVVATTYTLDQDNNWKQYSKARKNYDIYNTLNIFNGIWSNYSNWSGFSYDDFWFNSYSKSKIYFNQQENLFLSYSNYTFEPNENGTFNEKAYNEHVNPQIYLIVMLIITITFLMLAFHRFNKLDLK